MDFGAHFPKSARLLKRYDFRLINPRRFRANYFYFVSGCGSGRLGISISRKVLPSAAARNRIRRLVREVFRRRRTAYGSTDLHVIGLEPLKKTWRKVELEKIIDCFSQWEKSLG